MIIEPRAIHKDCGGTLFYITDGEDPMNDIMRCFKCNRIEVVWPELHQSFSGRAYQLIKEFMEGAYT